MKDEELKNMVNLDDPEIKKKLKGLSQKELQEFYDSTDAYYFYKKKKTDKIWWVNRINEIGGLEVSFDKKKILNLWEDYPKNFTPEEKELFDKENPYWADFFKGRCK